VFARFCRFFFRLVFQPQKQKFMLDLHGRWNFELSAKPDKIHHGITVAQTSNRPSRIGTRIGGTSQTLI
jgi:hypothetical protein